MNTPFLLPALEDRNVSESLTDPLAQLEWQVARRADELARARPSATSLNLHCWLVAETEIWHEVSGRQPSPGLP